MRAWYVQIYGTRICKRHLTFSCKYLRNTFVPKMILFLVVFKHCVLCTNWIFSFGKFNSFVSFKIYCVGVTSSLVWFWCQVKKKSIESEEFGVSLRSFVCYQLWKGGGGWKAHCGKYQFSFKIQSKPKGKQTAHFIMTSEYTKR